MKFCVYTVAVIMLLLLGFAGVTKAAPAPTAAEDIAIAEAHWGGWPTQCESVAYDNVLPIGDAGLATQPPVGWYGPCQLHITEVGAKPWATPEYVCLVAVHEEGHLHGLGHVTDPEAIMFGGTPLSAHEVPECVGATEINYAVAGSPAEAAPQPSADSPPRRRHRAFRRGENIDSPFVIQTPQASN